MTLAQYLTEEEWRPIPSHPNYMASNLGRIKSLSGDHGKPGRILKTNGPRYLRVCLSGKTMLVHRLIMAAFYGPSHLAVNHKNGNKKDNRLVNLEYVTHSENHRHAFATGLRKPTIGATAGAAKLTEKDVLYIRNTKERSVDLARKFNMSQQGICNLRKRRTWKHLP
jgi:hypothetical protein